MLHDGGRSPTALLLLLALTSAVVNVTASLFNEGRVLSSIEWSLSSAPFQGNPLPQEDLPLPPDRLQMHGTTTLSFIWNDSVIVAVDSRASIGSYVGSRTTKKIFPVSSHIVATMAGGAADCAHWIRRVTRQSRVYEFQYATLLPVVSIARQLALALREYRGMGLSVGTMVAGIDPAGPAIYYVDSEGTCIPGQRFCVGSGSTLAYAVLDSQLETLRNNQSAHVDDAVGVALWAIRHATYRDGYSGGYINVFHINSTGIHHLVRKDAKELLIET